MKKVWFILGLIAFGFVVQNWIASNERISIAEEEEAARIELEFSTALNSLIGDTGANDIWRDNLCASGSGRFRSLQIFSVELEKLWLDGKPILFEGSIYDVAINSESFYTVEFQHSNLFSYLTSACFLSDTLRLELRAPKSLIDPYLAQRQGTDGFFPPQYLLIAQVREVRSEYENRGGGEIDHILIGEGELIRIMMGRE